MNKSIGAERRSLREGTDDMVRGFLVWGRNYGEIESFKLVADTGRKWKITLPGPTAARGGSSVLDRIFPDSRIVPEEFVLTDREALAFGYGLAAAGARSESREAFAARQWGWALVS